MIELKAIRVSYGTRAVLDKLDLKIERGLVHAVVGPTGCGKTTLLHLLARLIEPSAGVLAFGRAEDARRVALIPQDYGLFPWKTVWGNAFMGVEIRRRKIGAAADASLALCERILSELRIAELRDRWPASLSGGQKQRVAIARALAVEPALLLMDEPFSALDADIRESLQDLVRSLPGRYGTTPVMVTHDIHEAIRIADRIILFRGIGAGSGAYSAEILANDAPSRARTEAALRAALREARGGTADA